MFYHTHGDLVMDAGLPVNQERHVDPELGPTIKWALKGPIPIEANYQIGPPTSLQVKFGEKGLKRGPTSLLGPLSGARNLFP